MELSCLSTGDSYSLNDGSIGDGAASCTCTKFTYSPDVTPAHSPIHRSMSLPTPLPRPLPDTEQEDDSKNGEDKPQGPRPEPNSDLFGIQLEVRIGCSMMF